MFHLTFLSAANKSSRSISYAHSIKPTERQQKKARERRRPVNAVLRETRSSGDAEKEIHDIMRSTPMIYKTLNAFKLYYGMRVAVFHDIEWFINIGHSNLCRGRLLIFVVLNLILLEAYSN